MILLLLVGFSAIAECFGNGIFHEQHSSSSKYMQEPLVKITDETGPSRKLIQFTKTEYLTPEVVEVTKGVHVAIGFALGNSIMVEGTDGVMIVDTTESIPAMREIMVEFRKITTKPVVAVVYTHFHADHHQGTLAVIEDGKALHPGISIDIYSHETTPDEIRDHGYFFDASVTRGTRQIGAALEKDDTYRTGSGLGPEWRWIKGLDERLVFLPTVTFSSKAEYHTAGVRFQLLHTPGETDDQITVWLPDYDVVLPGDNIYKTFPNLYAIRGTPTRDAQQWYRSLDIVRNLNAEYMVGSHTQPVKGKAAVYDTLLIYRDAIKYVHDQTVRLMNKGLFPNDIADMVKLPERVARHPFLQEHYGTVEWSVKGVFTNYMGWFSGNPSELHHLSSTDRSVRMLKLITAAQARDVCAVEAILDEAESSHKNSYHQYLATGKHNSQDDKWAIELVDLVISLGSVDADLIQSARQIKISALRALGIEQISANGRNYYLTYAMEMESGNSTVVPTKETHAYTIMRLPIVEVLKMICLKVKGLDCQYKNFTVGYMFIDEGKEYGLTLRNSVCDVLDPLPPGMETSVSLSVTTERFKSMNAENRDVSEDVARGSAKVTNGRIETFHEFMQCFDPPNSV